MVSAIFILLFLCAAHTLQDISIGDKGDSFSNSSAAVVGADEMFSMIEQQAALCPYISLCSQTNRSTTTFIASKQDQYPCCSECSCHFSCLEEGTCCPDFSYEGREVQPLTTRQEEIADNINEMSCVRTHHGRFNTNNDGYLMIASCPGNFTNQSIKERCEINIQVEETDSLVDVTPIFHIESAMSYKNMFCFLCNKPMEIDTQQATFWDSRLYCYDDYQPLLNYRPDSLKFGRSLLQYRCNIIFYTSFEKQGSIKPCTFNDIIESCKSEYVATQLETQCKQYRWPITGRPVGKSYKTEKYKNYACFLCNDRLFSDKCYHLTPELALTSIFLTKSDVAIAANVIKSNTQDNKTDLIYINQTINRYFPDIKGNKPCEKGFILDGYTDECRQVFCPGNFFLNNGTCIPIISKTEGIVYYHLFNLIVSDSLNVEDADAFEDAVEVATEQLLNKRISAGKYNLTLWRYADVQSKMNQKYFVLVSINDTYAAGNYLELLTVFYKLGTSVHQLEVGEKDKNIFEVEFRLTMDFMLQQNAFVGISGEVLHPRRPNSLLAIRDRLHVTMSLLCYRIAIATTEADLTKSRTDIFVKKTNKIISFPNYQRLKMEFDYRILVCLEYALIDIASQNKYIFDEYPSKMKPPQILLNHGDSRLKDYEMHYTNGVETEKETDLLERSIVMSVVTLLVVLIVVGSRVLLKRLTNR